MNKTQRLIELLLTMNTRKKYTLKELAERFGVSKRTVLRDLNELSAFGVPLYAELGTHGGYRILQERTLPPITFTEKEALALFFVSQSLRFYRSLPMETDWQTALAKFYHVLPDDVKARIDEWGRRLLFWVPEQAVECPHLPALLDAAVEQQVLRITYAGENGHSEREIQLIGLYAMNGKWYCPAFDFSSGADRLFRADRILSVSISPDQSKRRNHDHRLIADWVASEPERNAQEDGFELHVRLTRCGVLLCQSDAWLAHGLTVNEDGTGSMNRKLPASYLSWAASFFLRCGTDAVVTEPLELRTLIRQQLGEMTAAYNQTK